MVFHCHIDFHAEIGMGLILQVGEIHQMPKPPHKFPMCGNWKYKRPRPRMRMKEKPCVLQVAPKVSVFLCLWQFSHFCFLLFVGNTTYYSYSLFRQNWSECHSCSTQIKFTVYILAVLFNTESFDFLCIHQLPPYICYGNFVHFSMKGIIRSFVLFLVRA